MAAMVVETLGFEVRVCKWDVHLPQEESSASATSSSSSSALEFLGGIFMTRRPQEESSASATLSSSTSTLEFLGGIFMILLSTTLPTDSEIGIYQNHEIFFPKSSLKELECNNAAKKLIGAALKQLPNLGSCKNLEAVSQSLADDLLFRFKFGSEILSGDGAVPVINLRLEVYLRNEEPNSREDGNAREQTFPGNVRELIYVGDDVRGHELRRLCRKLWYGGRNSADVKEPPLGFKEVKPAMVIKCFEDTWKAKRCRICFEKFSEATMFVEASCSYRFHKKCLSERFSDNGNSSCPVCGAICIANV